MKKSYVLASIAAASLILTVGIKKTPASYKPNRYGLYPSPATSSNGRNRFFFHSTNNILLQMKTAARIRICLGSASLARLMVLRQQCLFVHPLSRRISSGALQSGCWIQNCWQSSVVKTFRVFRG